jgi:hypothetical protein
MDNNNLSSLNKTQLKSEERLKALKGIGLSNSKGGLYGGNIGDHKFVGIHMHEENLK